MISAIASAALIGAASLAVGGAICGLCGWRGPEEARSRWSWLSPAVGLAALLAVAAIAARLPGHAATAALALAALTAAALAYLAWSGPGWRGVSAGAAPAVAAALAAAIPFAVNDRVGILGAGLVNDDMASHLLVADWVQNRAEPVPSLVEGGYPLGPHSLVAALAEGLGADLVNVFAGLTLALAALAAMLALQALGHLPPRRRAGAAVLAGLPYLGAAYLAQGAFKEPLQALLVLGFALGLAELRRERFEARLAAKGGREARERSAFELSLPLLPLAVIAAGAVFNYSFPGLAWLAATAGIVWLGAGAPLGQVRRAVPVAAAAVALAAVLTAIDWGRIAEFSDFRAFQQSGTQALGNLRHSISPLEALGVWPSGEFRISPADASAPAIAFYAGGLLAAAALVAGLWRCRTERLTELPAALAASAAIYAAAAILGTPYTSAKALAIAAPVAMLIALRGVLDTDWLSFGIGVRRRISPRTWRRALTALGIAFAAAAALSSFLALRQAPVSPGVHAGELDRVRALTGGGRVLFLGRDDFIAWELRGARVATPLQNYYNVGRVPARFDLGPGAEKLDFDAVAPGVLDRYRFVLASATAYASEPPPNFRRALRTPSYVLYRRRGPTAPRATLNEGAAPGLLFDCRGRGNLLRRATRAAVWPGAPVEGSEEMWEPAPAAAPGEPARQTLRLAPGRWEISLAYDAPRPLTLRVEGRGLAGARAPLDLPANLDFRGPTPPFPAGRLRVKRPGGVTVTVELARSPLAGRLLGAEGQAHLRLLAATPLGAVRHLPPRRACGRYVDWLRPRR